MLIASATVIGFVIGVLSSLAGGLVIGRWDGGHGFAFGFIGSILALASSFFVGWYSLAVTATIATLWVAYVIVGKWLDSRSTPHL